MSKTSFQSIQAFDYSHLKTIQAFDSRFYPIPDSQFPPLPIVLLMILQVLVICMNSVTVFACSLCNHLRHNDCYISFPLLFLHLGVLLMIQIVNIYHQSCVYEYNSSSSGALKKITLVIKTSHQTLRGSPA